MGQRFAEEANDSEAALGVVLSLADRFGNTKTSTLWRFVEETHSELPMVGVVSLGKAAEAQAMVDGRPYVRYCVESPPSRSASLTRRNPNFSRRFDHTALAGGRGRLAAPRLYSETRMGVSTSSCLRVSATVMTCSPSEGTLGRWRRCDRRTNRRSQLVTEGINAPEHRLHQPIGCRRVTRRRALVPASGLCSQRGRPRLPAWTPWWGFFGLPPTAIESLQCVVQSLPRFDSTSSPRHACRTTDKGLFVWVLMTLGPPIQQSR